MTTDKSTGERLTDAERTDEQADLQTSVAATVREYLRGTDITRPSFHATVISHRLIPHLDRASAAQAEAGEVERLRAQVAAVEALTERWEREAAERGPEDRIHTAGTAAMLRAALDQAKGGES